MFDLSRPARIVAYLMLIGLFAVPTLAQNSKTRPTAGYDRLFLSFIEDATIIENQWWEGQVEFSDSDLVDTSILRGIVALRPMENLEVGGRVGFGRTDTPSFLPDGSGGTDLDLWAKWYIETGRRDTEFVVGSVATIPTGDDTVGLGQDAFSLSGFGAARVRFDAVVLSVHAGLRVNGDAQTLGLPETDGKLSAMLGAGAIYPLSDKLTLVGEADYEGKRFDGGDNEFRLLGGINWRLNNRGIVRTGVAVGLSDGSPDAQLLAGYATRF